MRIARDREAWRVSVWARRRGAQFLTDAPATWHPPKPGAEDSAHARERLGYLQAETGSPGLGSTYDLMVATARTGAGTYDWVRAPEGTPREALRLFPEGGASYWEAVLGAWDDFVEAIRDGDRWMQPLSTWRPAVSEREAFDLDTAARLLDDARQRPGVRFAALGDPAVRTARVLFDGEDDAARFATFPALEALVMDGAVTPALLAAVSALPRLAAFELHSQRRPLIRHAGGFRALELLSLPHLDFDPAELEPLLRGLPALHTLQLRECQVARVPPWFGALPKLRRLDLSGVPIPEDGLDALKAARPGLELTTSPVSLGWGPGIPGVLRVAAGFPVPDVQPSLGFSSGCGVAISGRQVTIHERWQDSPADGPRDFNERIHGPVSVEDFVRQGPPVALAPWDRARLRRQLEAGITGTSS